MFELKKIYIDVYLLWNIYVVVMIWCKLFNIDIDVIFNMSFKIMYLKWSCIKTTYN